MLTLAHPCARHSLRSVLSRFPRNRCHSTAHPWHPSPPLTLLSPPNPYIRPLPPHALPPPQNSTSPTPGQASTISKDFVLYPDILSVQEQKSLLRMALYKLDRAEGSRRRKRRKGATSDTPLPSASLTPGPREAVRPNPHDEIQAMFDPSPEAYTFHPAHYDSVISGYRETLLSNFPASNLVSGGQKRGEEGGEEQEEMPYPGIMTRLFALLDLPSPTESNPPPSSSGATPSSSSPSSLPTSQTASPPDKPFQPPSHTITHALHLSPLGHIRAHVDNVDASGGVILGVSLGAARVLRLERAKENISKHEELGKPGPDDDRITSPSSTEILDPSTSDFQATPPQQAMPEPEDESEASSGWDVLLLPGSVYVQRDSVRYGYAHSILPYEHEGCGGWGSSEARMEPGVMASGALVAGHRVSLMIRDAKQ